MVCDHIFAIMLYCIILYPLTRVIYLLSLIFYSLSLIALSLILFSLSIIPYPISYFPSPTFLIPFPISQINFPSSFYALTHLHLGPYCTLQYQGLWGIYKWANKYPWVSCDFVTYWGAYTLTKNSIHIYRIKYEKNTLFSATLIKHSVVKLFPYLDCEELRLKKNLGFWLKFGGRGLRGSKGPTLLSGIILLLKNDLIAPKHEIKH